VALAGWTLFVYWWWLVLGRASRTEIVYTAVFIGVTTVIVVLVTAGWAVHNKRLHRRSPPRDQVRVVHEDYSRDTLGRGVTFVGGAERVKSEPHVQVVVSENHKVYHPALAAVLENR
jgi:hypothetical protein